MPVLKTAHSFLAGLTPIRRQRDRFAGKLLDLMRLKRNYSLNVMSREARKRSGEQAMCCKLDRERKRPNYLPYIKVNYEVVTVLPIKS